MRSPAATNVPYGRGSSSAAAGAATAHQSLRLRSAERDRRVAMLAPAKATS